LGLTVNGRTSLNGWGFENVEDFTLIFNTFGAYFQVGWRLFTSASHPGEGRDLFVFSSSD
jgi:hypothetical protein